jgi:YidC/Oxa1 family membrane protein insertase
MHGLTRRALASGHQMQKLQPKIKELREKYKDDQTKLHQETMRLWREHGVSPWGSCLPMLIQIPVFFALYGTFARDFAIRQALFIPGWIEDLSQPDALFDLPFVVPLLGWTNFNLLPILYVAMQLFHQSMTPKSEDPNVAQQQQMMKIMPILFMFIFYPMPSGLVLYFTVSACYTAVEHWFIRRRLDAGETQAAGAPAAAGQGIGNEGGKGGKRKKKKR